MDTFAAKAFLLLQSPHFLLFAATISVFVKIYYFITLTPLLIRKNTYAQPLVYLLVSIGGALVCDSAWIVYIIQQHHLWWIPFYIPVFFGRLAWGCLAIQYYALALFLNALVYPQFRFTQFHWISTLVTTLTSGYYFFIAFFMPFTLATKYERGTSDSFEIYFAKYVMVYVILFISYIGVYCTYREIRQRTLPYLVKCHLYFFVLYLMLPYFALEILIGLYTHNIKSMLFLVSISTLLLSVAILYCLKKVLRLRFMNNKQRVDASPNPELFCTIRHSIETLSDIKNTHELFHIIQTFFKDIFGVTSRYVHIKIHTHNQEPHYPPSHHSAVIDSSIACYSSLLYQQRSTVLVKNELELTAYYEPHSPTHELLHLLSNINADVLLPLWSDKVIHSYIIVLSGGLSRELSAYEQDALTTFTNYVGHTIKLLSYQQVNFLLHKEKQLSETLYTKHQEINHYKESIHYFLKKSRQNLLGIISYRQGHFHCINHEAQEILGINPNTDKGHPTYETLQNVVQHIEAYATHCTEYIKDEQGSPVIVSGIPSSKQPYVLITLHYPHISDIIMNQIHLLNDPQDWDYILYLEATHAGTLINRFLPGTGEHILNIKINLLKAALSKKALFIDAPSEDIAAIAYLIHTIGKRDHYSDVMLHQTTSYQDIAPKLFGSTRLQNPSLLQQLSTGTLAINNMHYLDKETQKELAHYLQHGTYRKHNSSEHTTSTCRLLFSSSMPLDQVSKKNDTDQLFLSLLQKGNVHVPSPAEFTEEEIKGLIEGILAHEVTSFSARHLLKFSQQEQRTLIEQSTSSITNLKQNIHRLINEKSTQLSPQVSHLLANDTPLLAHAAKLGRQALKNERLIALLWEKFKNQNKIALFLGVNRSSISRRCKIFTVAKGQV